MGNEVEKNSDKVAEVMKSIPFENIIGGPLAACIRAQEESAVATRNYLEQAALKRCADPADGWEPVTISFFFQIGEEMQRLTLPLLSILPIPYVQINEVDLTYKATITACDNERFEAKYTADDTTDIKRRGNSELVSKNYIDIHVHATPTDMPSGVAKLIDIFSNQLIEITEVKDEEPEALPPTEEAPALDDKTVPDTPEAKPAETKPSDTKPAETKPAETTPSTTAPESKAPSAEKEPTKTWTERFSIVITDKINKKDEVAKTQKYISEYAHDVLMDFELAETDFTEYLQKAAKSNNVEIPVGLAKADALGLCKKLKNKSIKCVVPAYNITFSKKLEGAELNLALQAICKYTSYRDTETFVNAMNNTTKRTVTLETPEQNVQQLIDELSAADIKATKVKIQL